MVSLGFFEIRGIWEYLLSVYLRTFWISEYSRLFVDYLWVICFKLFEIIQFWIIWNCFLIISGLLFWVICKLLAVWGYLSTMHTFVSWVRVQAGPRLDSPAGVADCGSQPGSNYYWVTSENLIKGGLMILSCPGAGAWAAGPDLNWQLQGHEKVGTLTWELAPHRVRDVQAAYASDGPSPFPLPPSSQHKDQTSRTRSQSMAVSRQRWRCRRSPPFTLIKNVDLYLHKDYKGRTALLLCEPMSQDWCHRTQWGWSTRLLPVLYQKGHSVVSFLQGLWNLVRVRQSLCLLAWVLS